MRSPVIAFGIFAAAAVSPSLVSAAPASTPGSPNLANVVPGAPPLPALPLPGAPAVRRDTGDVAKPPAYHSSNDKHKSKGHKRAFDSGTAGGNAYSGGSSASSGGTIVNEGEDSPNDVVTNDLANAAGTAGASETGDAEGGRGFGFGPGGNAYTGPAGNAQGGSVINEGGVVTNTGGSNIGGLGNPSTSGDAEGGDAFRRKRAVDYLTGGGNAYTGSSGDTGSGNIINEADSDATITNTGPGTNFGNLAGTSTTGDALGGNGDAKGPGGNAYSGFAGPTRGGNVINDGGSVDNTGATNAGGDGNDSVSGNAEGGDAANFIDDDDEFDDGGDVFIP